MDLGVSWNWGVPKPLNGRGLSWWHLHPMFSTSELCSTAGSLLRTPNPVIRDQLKPFPNRWNQKVYSNSKTMQKRFDLPLFQWKFILFCIVVVVPQNWSQNLHQAPKGSRKAAVPWQCRQGGSKFDSNLALFLELQNWYPRFDLQDYL